MLLCDFHAMEQTRPCACQAIQNLKISCSDAVVLPPPHSHEELVANEYK